MYYNSNEHLKVICRKRFNIVNKNKLISVFLYFVTGECYIPIHYTVV